MRRLALVSLLVRDYDEALRFFCGTLEFALVEDRCEPGKRWVVVAPARDMGAAIVLARASDQEQDSLIGRQAGGRVAFFLYTDDFRRDFERYSARGVKFIRPPARADYGTVAVFEDLYGNRWDLVGPTV